MSKCTFYFIRKFQTVSQSIYISLAEWWSSSFHMRVCHFYLWGNVCSNLLPIKCFPQVTLSYCKFCFFNSGYKFLIKYKYFPSVWGMAFHFLNGTFWGAEVQILSKSTLSAFSFTVCDFMSYQRTLFFLFSCLLLNSGFLKTVIWLP